MPEKAYENYANKMKELLEIELNDSPIALSLDDEAQASFKTFQLDIEKQMAPGKTLYKYAGWGSKVAGYSLRIAGILHVIEFSESNSVIKTPTTLKAITLCHFLVKHAIIAFNFMTDHHEITISNEVLKWIRSNNLQGFTKS